ncbi:hypothetical protein DPMN_075570 [Dreissena polymorpha]|uniref:Uncharacterized protein n=1 Tax=Dreissena polymorpha TaxID=45954 RepID=A0A9D4BMT0_DREPO|nr:hypothetical protein DPMN_075570 [Dreissena polymorpha]
MGTGGGGGYGGYGRGGGGGGGGGGGLGAGKTARMKRIVFCLELGRRWAGVPAWDEVEEEDAGACSALTARMRRMVWWSFYSVRGVCEGVYSVRCEGVGVVVISILGCDGWTCEDDL